MFNYYWDSGAFLAFFNEELGRVKHCRQVLEAAERGEIRIITSALTLTEVVHIKGRQRMDEQKESIIRDYFEKKYIILIDVNRKIAEFARKLIWKNSQLQPKDSIHVASAILSKVDALHTYDEPLLNLNGKIGEPPLLIQEPKLSQPDLDNL